MEHTIKKTEEEGKGRFYMEDDKGMMGQADYTLANKVMNINHVEVREDMQGEGLASKILDHAVTYAKDHQMKVNPVCSYAVARFKKKSEYQAIQA